MRDFVLRDYEYFDDDRCVKRGIRNVEYVI